jgi:hypothetical protein
MTAETSRDPKPKGRLKYRSSKTTTALIIASMLLVLPVLASLAPVYAQTQTIGSLDDAEFMLSITPAAPSLPADAQSYYMIVQLVTTDGKPAEAPYDIDIRTSSSDPSVITLPADSVVLKKGETMTKMDLVTTAKPGIVSITASASGIESATIDINTISLDSLDPTKLAVYAAPSSLLPDPKYSGFVYIQLLNSQGLPAVAKKSVAVSLSSSESTIATIQSTVSLTAGQSGALVDLTPGENVGQAQITASAAGLSPGTAIVYTDGIVGSKLVVEFAPPVIAAEPYATVLMSVQLRDNSDTPVKAAKPITVELRSSDRDVLDPPLSVQIPAGKSYVTTYAETRNGSTGEATITATATGLQAGFAAITAVDRSDAPLGSSDKTLGLYLAPSVLPPDNSAHQTIVVAFFDSQGRPVAESGQTFQKIVLSSSENDFGALDETALVTRTMYALSKFNTYSVTGTTTLTAALAGYSSAQEDLKIEGSAPTTISLTQIPGIVQATDKASNSLVVSLLDQNGNPVSATKDTSIFLTSSSPEIATVGGLVNIAAGESHTVASVKTTLKQGATTITGSSMGLNSGSVEFTTAGFSGSVSAYTLGLYTIERIPADGRVHEAIVVQMQDQNGNPVNAASDVVVSLSSSSFAGGDVQSSVTIPKGSNYATASFIPSKHETNEIVITASSQGFQSVDTTISTTLQPLAAIRSGEIPKTAPSGAMIPVIVDVFSAKDLPVEGATVAINVAGNAETIGVTDANGHFDGEYMLTVPGQNILAIVISKPGYQDLSIKPSLSITKTVQITVSAESEAGRSLTAQIGVKGPTTARGDTTKPGAPITLTDAKFGSYTLTPKAEVKTADSILTFVRWSDGSTVNPRTINVLEDTEMTAIYSAQYKLTVQTEQGTATGGGFYAEGTRASFSISPTSIPGILIDKNFGGWSGSMAVASPTAEVTMNSPITVTAIWTDSYLKVFLIIGAAAGGGIAYYLKVLKPKREAIERDKAPDLDWFKG